MNDYYLFKTSDIEPETKDSLDLKYKYVISVFEEKAKLYNVKKYNANEYNNAYIFEGKYVVYVGVMSTIMMTWDKEKYSSLGSDEYINKRYSIIIRKMVYDEDFIFDCASIGNKCNEYFGCRFVICDSVDQYKVRDFKGETSLMFDNYDRFHTIAQLFENQFNLYGILSNNQESQTIDKNYDIKKAEKYYNKIFKLIQKWLCDYKYEVFVINNYEKVLLIEDTLVIYIGVKGKRSLFNDKQEKNGNIIDRYAIVIQELTYNEIFNKRSFSKFIKEIHIMDGSYVGSEKYNNLYYRPYSIGNSDERITKGYNPRIYSNSNFDYVNKMLPKLKLSERYNNWIGIIRYYIVYEFKYNNKVGFAVSSTPDSNPRLAARTIINNYEKKLGYLGMWISNFHFDSSWGLLMEEFVKEQKERKWDGIKKVGKQHSVFAERVTYFIVPFYLNNKNIHEDIASKIIADTKKGKYKDYERTTYDISEYKWKSEELMFECVKKVFKKKTVIHQYRPYYLRQLSYDVFVCGKDIAFEYQGEQHFKPVDIFGGVDNYKKQQERDKLKAILSKNNGVTLIYVNYWEDITTDLIKEKLKDAGINI